MTNDCAITKDLTGIIAWPFLEAKKLLDLHNWKAPDKGYLLFETGYGPSGLPHIGTFGEVARTVMVMNAVKLLHSTIPLKLIVFSDDLDGLRKVPDNIPNGEDFVKYIGTPVSRIPDPFGQFESYAAYMNNNLKEFLDSFGFEYELQSSSKRYESGHFNDILYKTLEQTESILKIMLPTLGQERRANYHPFLPISQKTGKFAFGGVKSYDVSAKTITFDNDLNEEETISIENGTCKLQWKVDWAMRWAALNVDYEMHGMDLIPTVVLSKQICKLIGGGNGPLTYTYELFCDELGQKISKSKGNGVSVQDWMSFGTLESIALFMYDSPSRTKKLYLKIIPKYVDDYIKCSKHLNHDENNKADKSLIWNNPAFHIPLKKRILSENFKIDFSLIMHLASVCNPDGGKILLDYVKKYQNDLTPDEESLVDELIEKALNFYNKMIKPFKKYHQCSEEEIGYFRILTSELEKFFTENVSANEEEIQNKIYSIAKEIGYTKANMRDWFKLLYGKLFGQESGPRMGSFINMYGKENFIKLLSL